MMISKIADRHLSRQACIYIRQSTPGQVRFNQESTERQYHLASKARSLGWNPQQIRSRSIRCADEQARGLQDVGQRRSDGTGGSDLLAGSLPLGALERGIG